MTQPRVVCILGMHRAGTSDVARALSAAGVGLGDNLRGPDAGNPKGYFENLEILGLNDRLLSEVGHHWSSVGIIDAKEISVSRHREIAEKAAEILTRYTSRFPVWGFKDPRTARLLPFWLEVFAQVGLPAAYVISLRNPLSVAKSLESTDRIAGAWSQIMWMQHYFAAFRYSEGKPRLVIDYDLLLSNPEAQMRRIASFMHIREDQRFENGLKEYCEVFPGPGLRHHNFDSAMPDENVAPMPGLRQFYEWALDFAKDEVPVEKPGEKCFLKTVNESLQSRCGAFSLLDALDSQIQHYKALSYHVPRLLEFLKSRRGRILLSLRLLPRWMEQLDRDANENRFTSKRFAHAKRVLDYVGLPCLYSLTLRSSVEYEQPLEQREATSEFSIVVPVHDAPDVIGRCFLSMERYAPKAEIILVDDGSEIQETRDIINSYADRNSWKLIRHPAPKGHSRACESGAQEATRKYLCFLNSDTVVTPWSWSAVLAAFDADETIGVAGPSTSLAGNRQTISMAYKCRHLWTDGQICSYALRYTARQPKGGWVDLPEFVAGFAFFIRRSLWEQLGGFDIGLPDYGNEVDLCLRVKQQGYRIVWVKGSYIHHFGEMSYSKFDKREHWGKRNYALQFLKGRWGSRR